MVVIQEHYRNVALNLGRSLHQMAGVVNHEDGFQKNIKANYNNLTMVHSLCQHFLQEIKNIRGEQLFETLKKHLIDLEICECEKFLNTILDNTKYLKCFLTLLHLQKNV